MKKLRKIPKQPEQPKKKKRKKKVKRIPLPVGALDTARLIFFGQTLGFFYQTGYIRWVKVQPDGSLKIKRTDGTFGEVPLMVCCTRDRRFAYEFVRAMCLNEPIPDDVLWQMDFVDKELNKIMSAWNKMGGGGE